MAIRQGRQQQIAIPTIHPMPIQNTPKNMSNASKDAQSLHTWKIMVRNESTNTNKAIPKVCRSSITNKGVARHGSMFDHQKLPNGTQLPTKELKKLHL